MHQVLLALHLIVVLAMIGVILLQPSEGGLGLGGGGGLGGLMSSRGQANLFTKATAILAALFFALSLALAVLSTKGNRQSSIMDGVSTEATSSTPLNTNDAGGAPSNSSEPALPPVTQD